MGVLTLSQPASGRDLTPDPGRALDNSHFELAPDGSAAVTGWAVWDDAAAVTEEVAVITMATGERRTLLSAPGHDFSGPRISPDGRLVACMRSAHDSYEHPGDVTLVVTALAGGAGDGAGGDGGLRRKVCGGRRFVEPDLRRRRAQYCCGEKAMNLALSHFATVILFAIFASIIFGITQRSAPKAMIRYGAYCFVLFLAAVIAASWVMYFIRH